MGLVHATITLSNPVKPNLRPMEVKCLVDSGSTFLCIPAHIANQLELTSLETREATLADGSLLNVPYSGPIKVGFENRNCFVGGLILGNEVLLGAVPMEDMDLVIHPKLLKLSVNPENPNIPGAIVK
jgi:clan AA aspartic protease